MGGRIVRAAAVGAAIALLLASLTAQIEGRRPAAADPWQVEKLDRGPFHEKAPR